MDIRTNRTLGIQIILTVISMIFIDNVYSQEYWIEVQSENSFRKTDFYISDLGNYYLNNLTFRIGSRLNIETPKFDFEPYIIFSIVDDMGHQDWNEVDWHNNLVGGLGIRLRFYPKSFLFLNPSRFNCELFGEHFWISYFSNDIFFTGHRPKTDIKAGFRYWLVLGENLKSLSYDKSFWLENAISFFYSKSSFFNRSQNNYFLANLHGKLGLGEHAMKIKRLSPYIVLDFSIDFGRQEWNKLDWHNRAYFGLGSRYKYQWSPKTETVKFNLILTPFVELLWIKYLKRVQYIPSYRPNNDFRCGVNVWFSFNSSYF